MKKMIYIVMLCLMALSCKTQTDMDFKKGVDKHLKSLIQKDKTPSVSYLFFNKDSVLHSFRSGFADISNNKYVNENTSYAGFSATKTFTALCILQLAEKGKLSIDDKINKYISEFPYSPDITIRHLLAHTAGLPNPIPLRWVHSPEQNQSFDRDKYFKQVYIENRKEKSTPNEKFKYSNLGYFFLGQIIENVSDLSYEEYVLINIISPLELEQKNLGFRVNNENQHAKGYQKKFSFMNLMLGLLMDKSQYVDSKEGKWISFKEMIVNGPSYGGLIGNSKSFMIYIQELLKPDCKILSEEYKKMLFTENLTVSNKKTGMCLSWFKGELNNKIYYSHAGGGAGYYCEIRIYPDKGLGSVIMFNRSGVKDERILDKIDNYYFNY